MKVLDVSLFREGLQRNVETLTRLEEEMQMIQASAEQLISLQDSLKGEGGDAIRAFYENCHLPFLEYFTMFKSGFVTTLKNMEAALHAFEPASDGYINEGFLLSEVEGGLSRIATVTGNLTDDSNAIMDQVSDIISLPHLDDNEVQQGVRDAKRQRDRTVTDLNEYDASQTRALTAIQNEIQKMDQWINDMQELFKEGLTDVKFKQDSWMLLTRNNPLKAELTSSNAMIGGVAGLERFQAPNQAFNWSSPGDMNSVMGDNLLATPGMMHGSTPYGPSPLTTLYNQQQEYPILPTYAASSTTTGTSKKDEPEFVLGGDTAAIGKYGTVSGGAGLLKNDWSGINDADKKIGGGSEFSLIHGKMGMDTDYVDAEGNVNILKGSVDAKIDDASVLGVELPLPLAKAEAKGLEYDGKTQFDRNMPYLGEVIGGTGIKGKASAGNANAYAGFDNGSVGVSAKASLVEGELNPTIGIPFTNYDIKLTFGLSAGSVGGEAKVGKEFVIDLRFLVGGKFGIGVEKGAQ